MRVPLLESGQDSAPEVDVWEERYWSLSWKKICTSELSCCVPSRIVTAASAVPRSGAEASPKWLPEEFEGAPLGDDELLFSLSVIYCQYTSTRIACVPAI